MILLIILMNMVGCGLSEKTEKRLFYAMQDNDLIDLTCDFEDYDEVRVVDQSPIPVNIRYYDYSKGKRTYTIDYNTRSLGNNDSVYQVRVTIKSKKGSQTDIYYFEKDSFEFRKKK